jgi:hypothetical protein
MGILDNLFGSRLPAVPAENRREIDDLISELVEIGRNQDFLSERPGGEFNAQCHNIRARAIGRRFNDLGGQDLMQAVYARVRRKLGSNMASHLEYAWDGIGKWVA